MADQPVSNPGKFTRSPATTQQPPPSPAPPAPEAADCWLAVMNDVIGHPDLCEDMEARRAYGLGKYKVPVKPHNGRDALLDAYQELLDAAVYLKQKQLESIDARVVNVYHAVLTQLLRLYPIVREKG